MSRLKLTDYKQPPVSTTGGSSGSFSQPVMNPSSQPPTPNTAVSTNIVERDSANSNFEMPKISSTKKKVSLFKQRRQKTWDNITDIKSKIIIIFRMVGPGVILFVTLWILALVILVIGVSKNHLAGSSSNFLDPKQ